MEKTMKLGEIASRIRAHLERIETSRKGQGLHTEWYMASAWVAGSRVGVRYVSYQITTYLTKSDATEYLAWLDAGNEGKHYKALSFDTRLRKDPTNDRG